MTPWPMDGTRILPSTRASSSGISQPSPAGQRYGIALPSSTAGLHLALMALGIGPGDEVIVPDVTWIATSAPISYVGATAVFADFDPASWCMTADSIEAVLTPRTRAVIVVDLYGNMPDFDTILELCDERNVAVIEDAAEAVGATYKGRPAGSFGTAAHSASTDRRRSRPARAACCCSTTSHVQRCLALRDHGRAPGDVMYWSHTIGHKYRMSSMQAALGMAQLERLPELISRKREILDWYRSELADLPSITLNSETADVLNTYWMVTVVLDPNLGWTKEKVILALREHDIDCRPFFHPLSMLPAYHSSPAAAAARARNSASYAVSPYGVNLPSALSLTEDDVAFVASKLKILLRGP